MPSQADRKITDRSIPSSAVATRQTAPTLEAGTVSLLHNIGTAKPKGWPIHGSEAGSGPTCVIREAGNLIEMGMSRKSRVITYLQVHNEGWPDIIL